MKQTWIGPQFTCEAGKALLQVRRLDFVGQDVCLVEEEDDGGVEEPGRMDGGVEESQTLIHTVLQRQSDLSYWLQHLSLNHGRELVVDRQFPSFFKSLSKL